MMKWIPLRRGERTCQMGVCEFVFKFTLPLEWFASHMDSVLEQSVRMIKESFILLSFISQSLPLFYFYSKSSTSLNAEAVMTRFDRLKKKYKGPKIEYTSDDLDFSYEEFDKAVADTSYAFNRNDIVKGTVVQYDNGGCIVDIGAKASAYMSTQEASLFQEHGTLINDIIDIDAEMEFQIISEEDENGQLYLSLKRIQYRQAWEKVIAQQATDEVFEAEVVAVNRGGAICLVEGLRAFLPGSHLTLKFLEVNQDDNKLVVSNRRAIVEQQMSDLSRGDIISGVVKALKPYGAFVEVGGMSGLLHISQISYDRIEDLEKVLQPGQVVKCMIIDHDKVNGRIALSTKTLEPEPGDMLKDSAKVFELAEDTAKKYHERMEAERKAREDAAKDIVLGLGDSLDNLTDDAEDPLADVSDNLDSLLS
jgi:small subunit ribosomal protein S1